MKNHLQKTRNSCGGQGCSKDLFTLPYCGGKGHRVLPRRLRLRNRDSRTRSGIETVLKEGYTFHIHPFKGW